VNPSWISRRSRVNRPSNDGPCGSSIAASLLVLPAVRVVRALNSSVWCMRAPRRTQREAQRYGRVMMWMASSLLVGCPSTSWTTSPTPPCRLPQGLKEEASGTACPNAPCCRRTWAPASRL
jgi:hypothetical protein